MANGDEVNIYYSDIIKNLDLTLMSTVAVRKAKWSFLVNVIYLDLSAGDKGSLAVPTDSGLTVGTDLEVGLKSWVVTPLIAYKLFETPKASFDFAVGARYLWIENDLKLQTMALTGNSGFSYSFCFPNSYAETQMRGFSLMVRLRIINIKYID